MEEEKMQVRSEFIEEIRKSEFDHRVYFHKGHAYRIRLDGRGGLEDEHLNNYSGWEDEAPDAPQPPQNIGPDEKPIDQETLNAFIAWTARADQI